MMMKLTTTLLMMVMNVSSPDPGGHSHTDLCFFIVYNVHSHLGLAQQVVYLVPAGFTTCWLSGQFSLISIVLHLVPEPEGQPEVLVLADLIHQAGWGRSDDTIPVNEPQDNGVVGKH